MIRKIEIDFALKVEMTDNDMRRFCDLVQEIAKRHQPEGWYHWQAGCGSKANFSQADQRFLGKDVDPNAPESGEPTWDDDVFHIETAAREAYPEELERDRQKAARKASSPVPASGGKEE